jgi:hypothetical protein
MKGIDGVNTDGTHRGGGARIEGGGKSLATVDALIGNGGSGGAALITGGGGEGGKQLRAFRITNLSSP